jgi:putative transposase
MKNKSFKYRIYPNQKQEEFILQHFGASRFIWNYFLNERKEYYLKNKEKIEEKRIKGGLNYFDNAKRLTELKKEK